MNVEGRATEIIAALQRLSDMGHPWAQTLLTQMQRMIDDLCAYALVAGRADRMRSLQKEMYRRDTPMRKKLRKTARRMR